MDDTTPLDAGDLRQWLDELRAALRGEGDTDVPCAGCTACWEASHFIHGAPHDTDALAPIPSPRLVPALRAPPIDHESRPNGSSSSDCKHSPGQMRTKLRMLATCSRRATTGAAWISSKHNNMLMLSSSASTLSA